jgi:hypothetical protein
VDCVSLPVPLDASGFETERLNEEVVSCLDVAID